MKKAFKAIAAWPVGSQSDQGLFDNLIKSDLVTPEFREQFPNKESFVGGMCRLTKKHPIETLDSAISDAIAMALEANKES
jgi:hypothetical protein